MSIHIVRWLSLAAVLLTLMWGNCAAADDAPPLSASSQEVLLLLSSYNVRLMNNNAGTEVSLVRRPLLTFGDAARDNEAGTLWVWTAADRPVAFVENYLPVGDSTNWIQALTLSSSRLLEMQIDSERSWKPQRAQFNMQRCPGDAGSVAATPVQRLRQMKEISRRFKAHEFWDPDNSRFELRLLVQPVFRYGAPDTEVTDAAVFVLAHGTNPEVLLQIEASRENGAEGWKFGLLRLGSAEMHVFFDDREVWTVPRTPGVVGQPNDPYWLCVLPNRTRTSN